MATSDNKAYWHCLLPEEIAVIKKAGNGAVLDELDLKMLNMTAERLEMEALEQARHHLKSVRDLAIEMVVEDDDTDVDEDATVTETDSGFWVQGWLWVSDEEVDEFTEREEE
jgi:uncharacterized cupredoxin-like copper-binding protein